MSDAKKEHEYVRGEIAGLLNGEQRLMGGRWYTGEEFLIVMLDHLVWAETHALDATIAELRLERDALRTLAGNIYALMIERGEDDCAFVDPAAVQDELRAECKRLGVMPWQRTAPAVDGGGDGKDGGGA